MSKAKRLRRIKALEGYLVVAKAQAELTVADISFCLQRDYALSTDIAFATAQEIKERSYVSAALVRKELSVLKNPLRVSLI